MDWLKETNLPDSVQQFVLNHGSCFLDQPRTADIGQLQEIATIAKANNGSQAIALQSALLLAIGDLERSHELSQNIHTPIGSYLHGIMHRREGDFSNAKYWFHRSRPLHLFNDYSSQISCSDRKQVSEVELSLDNEFEPIAFTDCFKALRTKSAATGLRDAVNHIAWFEWRCIVHQLIKG